MIKRLKKESLKQYQALLSFEEYFKQAVNFNSSSPIEHAYNNTSQKFNIGIRILQKWVDKFDWVNRYIQNNTPDKEIGSTQQIPIIKPTNQELFIEVDNSIEEASINKINVNNLLDNLLSIPELREAVRESFYWEIKKEIYDELAKERGLLLLDSTDQMAEIIEKYYPDYDSVISFAKHYHKIETGYCKPILSNPNIARSFGYLTAITSRHNKIPIYDVLINKKKRIGIYNIKLMQYLLNHSYIVDLFSLYRTNNRTNSGTRKLPMFDLSDIPTYTEQQINHFLGITDSEKG